MLPDPLLEAELLRLPPAPDQGDVIDDDDLDKAESAEASRIARGAAGNAAVRRRGQCKAKASRADPSLAVQLVAAPEAVDAAVPEGVSSDDDKSSTSDEGSGSDSSSDSDSD
jgi:hypothetical protein